jgi:hypothetical protein
MSDLKSIMDLFQGFRSAYGTYRIDPTQISADGKAKGEAATLRQEVTEELWEQHLAGTESLGVITITEESQCHWGCIDIDRYDLDLQVLSKRLQSTPFILCRSKSGGAHVLLFLSDPVPAATIQSKLRDIASDLGFGGCEIFPKQTHVNLERGDLGNWLNMPYFGDPSTRYCIHPDQGPLTLQRFIAYANSQRVTPAELDKLTVEDITDTSREVVAFEDGPACFEKMLRQGKISENRNISLVNMGVYAKKKWPQNWEGPLMRMNGEYFNEPLPADEVVQITRNLKKKEYQYQCNSTPLCDFCNSSLCRQRKFGVSDGDFPIRVLALRRYESEPVVWFMDIADYGTLELNTKQLRSAGQFAEQCLEQKSFLPPIDQKTWIQLLAAALDKVLVIEMSDAEQQEVTVAGSLGDAFKSVLARGTAENWEEAATGRPYVNGEHIFFKSSAIQEEYHKISREMISLRKLSQFFKDMGCEGPDIKRAGRTTHRFWHIRKELLDE